MDFKTGRPDHIEDYLLSLHSGQWFGWSDSKNKVYANLIIHDDSKDKPTEQECTDGLATLQSDFDTDKTNLENNKASGKAKLKAGEALNDAELSALFGD
tara:strand:- start:22 stop:318 length:297 start_codon:yes stop_codon:yes gene_type:complete